MFDRSRITHFSEIITTLNKVDRTGESSIALSVCGLCWLHFSQDAGSTIKKDPERRVILDPA